MDHQKVICGSIQSEITWEYALLIVWSKRWQTFFTSPSRFDRGNRHTSVNCTFITPLEKSNIKKQESIDQTLSSCNITSSNKKYEPIEKRVIDDTIKVNDEWLWRYIVYKCIDRNKIGKKNIAVVRLSSIELTMLLTEEDLPRFDHCVTACSINRLSFFFLPIRLKIDR